MASLAEILALQAIGGNWGSELVNGTAWYIPPRGYAIKMVVFEEESVLAGAWLWRRIGLSAEEVDSEATNIRMQLPKNWAGETFAANAIISTHDKYPLSRIRLTSGSAMVYFCKGPIAIDQDEALNTTTTTEEIPL